MGSSRLTESLTEKTDVEGPALPTLLFDPPSTPDRGWDPCDVSLGVFEMT